MNPRAVILKRQARDKIVPNIPLPFNKIHSNTKNKLNLDPIVKAKRFVKNIQNLNFNQHKHDQEHKSAQLNIPKKKEGIIGDERESTPSIIERISNTISKKTTKQEIVRDARSVPEEQPNKGATETNRNDIYAKTIPFEELKSLDIVKRALSEEQFNRLRFLDDEKVLTNQ